MARSKFQTVDEYLATLAADRRERLTQVRVALRKVLPESEETISYSMPAFRQEGIVVWYAAAKNHYALYVYPRVKNMFADELAKYDGTKSAIHFDYNKPVPVRLIGAIAKESLRQNLNSSRSSKGK